jgi:aminoglycoside phosphotransferase (APT) family kinase protein
MDGELPLTGGRLTPGVVRAGDEVRRRVGPHSPFVHRVLAALERVGFDGAPRFLGMDDHGRERLSYMPGWVAPDLAHGEWADEQLVAAVELVRRFHDALSATDLAGAEETVCHNDLGPCNTVHRDRIPVGFIDWDEAKPGPRALDLGHAVWRWAIISDTEEVAIAEQVRCVRVMCDAYGAVDRPRVLDAVVANQDRVIANARRRGDRASLSWHSGERAWFLAQRDVFAAVLSKS